jgi:hypothetical protein
MSSPWESLAESMSGIPDLPGAACWGRWDLFDPEADRVNGKAVEDPYDRHQLALSICLNECPTLAECRVWVE